MGVALDLDKLSPQKAVIKYLGKDIDVNPLTLAQYAQMAELSSEVSKMDSEDPASAMQLYEKTKQFIDVVIPDFKEVDLNPTQIIAIFQLLATLNTPQDEAVAELSNQGISIGQEDSSDPKASAS